METFPCYWSFHWEFTRPQWILLTKASFDFLYAPVQTVELTLETLVIWDAISLIMASLIIARPVSQQ